MGLRRITGQQFNVSPEEWHKRQIRNHEIRQLALAIVQILGIAGFVIGCMYLIEWLGV